MDNVINDILVNNTKKIGFIENKNSNSVVSGNYIITCGLSTEVFDSLNHGLYSSKSVYLEYTLFKYGFEILKTGSIGEIKSCLRRDKIKTILNK